MGIDNESLNIDGWPVVESVATLGDLKLSQLDQLVGLISEVLYLDVEYLRYANFLVVLDGDGDLYVLNADEDYQDALDSFNLSDPQNILDHEGGETFTILEFIKVFDSIYQLKEHLIDQIIDNELTHFKPLFY